DAALARDDRPVVADGRSAAVGQRAIDAAVEIVPTPRVVCLPRRVGGLESDIAGVLVVAKNKRNDVLALDTVEARQLGEIDTRDRIGWNIPGRRNAPVAGVHQLRCRIEQRNGLVLSRLKRLIEGRDLACAVAVIVADTININ